MTLCPCRGLLRDYEPSCEPLFEALADLNIQYSKFYILSFQEDLLIHGDSIYDIVDKQDHPTLHVHLNDKDDPSPSSAETNLPKSTKNKKQIFLCRINVSRNARRQMRFGDQKVILVSGHFYR